VNRYWLIWLCALFVTFIVPETVALATGNPGNTLSWWVWRHVHVVFHQPMRDWSASHFLFAGIFTVFAVWLVGHLVWGIWR